ncbi:MAG: hypothetical protein IT476_12035 [Rhodanobacteraceae bacterium]|nr:hypothetical protein [Rhodanobacteraceae bacterium]
MAESGDSRLTDASHAACAAALRALPQCAPDRDLWPDLSRALQSRRRSHRLHVLVPLALAAGLAAFMLWPRQTLQLSLPTASKPTASNPAMGSTELADLQQRSQSMERWISALSHNAAQDSRDLMAAVEVEDLIGLIDIQLGAARDANDALPLWRKRVRLLEDLATIRASGASIAAGHFALTSADNTNQRIN